MGEELEEIFAKLKNDVIWVHSRWQIFQQLFRHSKERIELLNNCGSTFFYVTQNMFIEDACLGICRLTDRAQMREDQNLTIGQLIIKLNKEEHPELHKNLSEQLEKLKEQSDALRTLRHKKIAHRDFHVQMNAEENPLPKVSIEVIEGSLKGLREFMDTFELHFTKSQTAYEHVGLQADGRTLVSKLKKAMAYEELEESEKIEYGYWRTGALKDA